ncbi:thiopeptide-type bacteriocin biosynthesis protein [Hymenobacter sp. UYAg731]
MRTPVNAFVGDFDEDTVRRQASNPVFAEALYLASPSLYDETRRLGQSASADAKKEARACNSLLRYYARMSTRCTPFALFAGCAVVPWGAGSPIVRDPAQDSRHTRLDMHYLCALARELAMYPPVRERLRYFPNSSLYAAGEALRYTEFRQEAGQFVHQISSVVASEPLQRVLARSRPGATSAELTQVLLGDGTAPDEAQAFVEELIDGQLLVSELEPTVTGPEFSAHVTAVLARLQVPTPSAAIGDLQAVWQEVQAALAALDQPGAVNAREAYTAILEKLQQLGASVEESKLFQTDLTCGLTQGTLDQALQARLLDALGALAYLAQPPTHARLQRFAQLFTARYEDQEVPLLEALDDESGISYAGHDNSAFSPLVHDLTALADEAPNRSIALSEVQYFLYQKLRAADRNGDYNVRLTKDELRQFEEPACALPPSFSVVFSFGEAQQIVLESVGGSSAANLLGRFAHADPAVAQVVCDITAWEQEHNPGVRFAEVCHLPTSRVGNILLRPHFRALEIPFLAQSTLPPEQQVPAQDLLVSVRRGQVLLRSARHNCLVVPRLSTAHNYTSRALPVYHFLCDLQTQGGQSQLNLSWQAVSLYTKFLPRLTYEQVVLQPATWQLEAGDFQELLGGPAESLDARFGAFRARWHLPQRFTLADGDNELLVDAHLPATVRAWLDLVAPRASIRLKEFLFDPAHCPVTDAAGRPYVSQFVASLLRVTPSYAPPAPLAPHGAVPRNFVLGSEWFYTKLYCGPKVADQLLVDLVGPLTETLQAQGLADRWFFVRYADPDTHLRLRLHLADPDRLGEVIGVVNEYLEPYLRSGAVWKSQADTYSRELERYGSHTIEEAENLFYADSHHAVALLAHSAAVGGPDAEPWLWGLRLIDSLLDAFEYTPKRKLALLTLLRDAFAREFKAGKELRLQLDAKYRAHRGAIRRVLLLDEAEAAATGQPFALLAYHRSPAVQALAQRVLALHLRQELEVDLDELLGSYIHMLLNRLISAQPRLHELVLYDFLHRHYRSEQARALAPG